MCINWGYKIYSVMLLSSSLSKLKFISICHELCLYVVAINVCTGTSIALFYCTVVRSEHI